MLTDPIADMLTRIRNAYAVRHETVLVPLSKIKMAIAQVLKDEGFVRDFEVVRGATPAQRQVKLYLLYKENRQPILVGVKRVSKPGLRAYVPRKDIPRVYAGLGVAILSTTNGVMTGQQAWHQGIGGEVLCYVW